jgi:uncharacterized protein
MSAIDWQGPLMARLRQVAQARASSEPAHDFLHVSRVASSAVAIARAEGGDVAVCLAAALLHELFNYPKGHPDSHLSGEVCAEHARAVLRMEGAPPLFIDAVAYAIGVHPFSLGIVPATLEAKILQDADRLDAIGAIGIARCFATCAEMRRPFYALDDPFCARRAPDDKQWGLDHFYRKLLRIPETLHTQTARAMAQERVAMMNAFLDGLRREIE